VRAGATADPKDAAQAAHPARRPTAPGIAAAAARPVEAVAPVAAVVLPADTASADRQLVRTLVRES
jgi:hypothetical protein